MGGDPSDNSAISRSSPGRWLTSQTLGNQSCARYWKERHSPSRAKRKANKQKSRRKEIRKKRKEKNKNGFLE
jgi:hypothetical protein